MIVDYFCSLSRNIVHISVSYYLSQQHKRQHNKLFFFLRGGGEVIRIGSRGVVMFCRSESCHKLSILSGPMERRSVISHYHWRKISGSQESFLAETAICIVEQWKKSMGKECSTFKSGRFSNYKKHT